MTFTPAVLSSALYRDFVVEGVPASGKWRPQKGQLRVWGGEVEAYLTGLDTQLEAEETARAAADTALDGRLSAAEGSIVTLLARPVIPSGVILLWSGSVGSIPAGWVLCNGTSGTPDLRGRFVVGAGGAYAVAATGGAETVALVEGNMPSHTHLVNINTNAAGGHTHNGIVAGGAGGSTVIARQSVSTPTPSGGLIEGVGDHIHNVNGNTGPAGSGTAHENRPPYYALCYIMKT
jgi:microcystin-dependent protein